MKFVERFLLQLIILSLMSFQGIGQVVEREKPAEWDNLVEGGRFMDRFFPIPAVGKLTDNVWGAKAVVPRYVDNGIEDSQWSYWGGNILVGNNGEYNLFVCRWSEDSPRGHMEWPNSTVVHAISDNSIGPFKVMQVIGKGHNPEAFQMRDGRYVIYVIDGYYVSNDINGPWTYGKFDFSPRDRKIIEGLSNLSFAQREDGSYIMVDRGGGIWFSKDGISEYNQITDKRVYPDVDGRFEDPVIWRDNVQYNLIVNDWFGRIAWYLRSKDGIHWKVDPGEAYQPGIAVYEDGTKEGWFKFERIKILQDQYGRAIQANFAVIDTLKYQDKPKDRHSSKNIAIPLNKGMLLTILNDAKIDSTTTFVTVKITAESGFDPQKELDLNSLRFGASEKVNFGKGSKMTKSENSGEDVIVTFTGAGTGLTEGNFAAKIIGKKKDGKMVFGFARLPGIDYLEPALSARLPVLLKSGEGTKLQVEVQNFGQVASDGGVVQVEQMIPVSGQYGSAEIPALKPFEKTTVTFTGEIPVGQAAEFRVSIYYHGKQQETLQGKVKLND